MARFLLQRVAWTIAVLFALSALTFVIFFATPGVDPAKRMAGRNPSPATIKAIRREFDLDKPLPVQYVAFMNHLLIDRNLVSYTNNGVRVVPEIASAAPVTLSLVIGSAVLWLVFSTVIGTAAAVMRGRALDPLLMGLSVIGISMPVFWLAEVILYVTQYRFHSFPLFAWLPAPGYRPFLPSPISWATHLLLPWLTLSVMYVGIYARVLRSSLLDALAQDYVRTARAKGLSERRVLFAHAMRASLLTMVSLFGLDFGLLVGGGALLTEVVFGLPGVGDLTYQAISNLDLPTIMAAVVYAGFFIVIANTAVDILYARLDPRIRIA